MSVIARVRFANLSAPAVDITATPTMTVGQFKTEVWKLWPSPKPEVAGDEVPLPRLRITGHSRGDFLKDAQPLSETCLFASKDSLPLTTPDGSAIQLIALFRKGKLPAAAGSAAAAESAGCCTVM